jgi:ABC-type transport system involved in multi-copper enzyme maturation permease subunit
MNALALFWSIARYEMLLIFRSWAFRIFSFLALAIATMITVAVALPRDVTFFFNRALAGAFPLLAIKLFNVFIGLISVFLATEFLKRDRKQDTSQVYFTHSYSNATYILGKFFGIFIPVFLLNLFVLVVTAVIHVFFSRTPFAWQPYFLYIVFVSLPTILFMVGLSVFLGSLFRSQAVVYLIVLVYVFFIMTVVGPNAFFAFDSFAYYTPVMYSDFIGLGNLADLLLLRGAYLALGAALVFGSSLLMKRLRQTSWLSTASVFLSIGLAAAAAFLLAVYVREKTADRSFRAELKAESREPAEWAAMTMTTCDLQLKPVGGVLRADADLTLVNRNETPLETIILTVNPGLKIEQIRGPAGPLSYKQKNHLIIVRPPGRVEPGQDLRLSLSYAGKIDERYCYLDIGDSRYWSPLKFWLVTVPKRYAVVTGTFIYLSPECGWYPRAGLPPSLLFPKTIKQDFTRYSFSVTVPAGLTAISQGEMTENDRGRDKVFIFRPEGLLPQISLTVGRYDRKSISVDDKVYALYTLTGHDRFTSLLPEIKADLSNIIRQVKNEYEVLLGLPYPYKRFSLVEVPIQVTSYNRLWNTAQEQVQPELVFLPEMAALCTGADFGAAQRMMLGPGGGGATSVGRTSQATGGARGTGAGASFRAGAMSISPKDLQRNLLNRFIRYNLTEQARPINAMLRAGFLGIRFETNSESRFGIFPDFVTYTTYFAAPRWPLFNYVLDAYLRGRVSAQSGPGLRLAQTTSLQEEVSKILAKHSLAEILSEGSQGKWPLPSILEAKSKQLLALIQSNLGNKDFDNQLTEWLKGLRFQSVSEKTILDFFKSLGDLDLDATFARWSGEKGVPGFVFNNLQSYGVIEKEKQKVQLRFEVGNPTDKDGVIKVEYVSRGLMGGRTMGGGGLGGSTAERRYYVVPARTVKEIGIVLDQPTVVTTIDTFISKNVPTSFFLPFLTAPAQPGATVFDGEIDHPYLQAEPGASGEYVVDDEDPGFSVPRDNRENWLRRLVRKAFPSSIDEESEFAQYRDILNPPGQWTPVIMQNFFGRFVRSAYLKKSGNGQSRVVWLADLKEPGEYDISFFYAGIGAGPGFAAGMRGINMGGGRGGGMQGGRGGFGGAPGTSGFPTGQRGQMGFQGLGGRRGIFIPQPGKKHFIIHHQDGTEEVIIDLKNAQAGWNLIGTFRLAAGPNKVELTDRNDTIYVLADAVKWSRHKEAF